MVSTEIDLVKAWADSFHLNSMRYAGYPVTLAFFGRLLSTHRGQHSAGATIIHIGYTLWAKHEVSDTFLFREKPTNKNVSTDDFFRHVQATFRGSSTLQKWANSTTYVLNRKDAGDICQSLKKSLEPYRQRFVGESERDGEWFTEFLDVLGKV